MLDAMESARPAEDATTPTVSPESLLRGIAGEPLGTSELTETEIVIGKISDGVEWLIGQVVLSVSIVMAIMCLSVGVSHSHTNCDPNLSAWMIVQGCCCTAIFVFFAIRIGARVLSRWKWFIRVLILPSGRADSEEVVRSAMKFVASSGSLLTAYPSWCIFMFCLAWLIVGAVWLDESNISDECPATLYNWVYGVVVFEFALLGILAFTCLFALWTACTVCAGLAVTCFGIHRQRYLSDI